MENDALPTVIEAILFGSGRSMTVSEIALASQSDESDAEMALRGLKSLSREGSPGLCKYLRYLVGG